MANYRPGGISEDNVVVQEITHPLDAKKLPRSEAKDQCEDHDVS
jgi:hypothetical protein